MKNPFRYFNSSPEVIWLAVMMYMRYPISVQFHLRAVSFFLNDVRFGSKADVRLTPFDTYAGSANTAISVSSLGWPSPKIVAKEASAASRPVPIRTVRSVATLRLGSNRCQRPA